MNRLLLCLPFLAVMGCPPPCVAQITLSEQKVQVVSGLVNPQLIGDAILIDQDSKPVIATASLIELKQEKPYKFCDIEAENVANYSLGELTKIDDSHWLLTGTGKYRISAMAFDPDLARARLFVELGVPPGPGPGPGPTPGPTPGPQPDGEAPIPEPGFRVLIVYETADLANLPRWLADGDFRGYLDSHCVKGDKGVPEYRIVDPQIDVSHANLLWAKALGRKRDSLPWLIVSNGKTGFEGPLPKTKSETLAVLAKYAEAK